MNYIYDPEADALYIELSDAACFHQMETPDGVILDVAADGSLVGIDVMVPSSGWDPEEIINVYKISEPDAQLLRHLAALRTWTPLRGPASGNQTTGGHAERLLVSS
jgi:uncharacterized protein YuzE